MSKPEGSRIPFDPPLPMRDAVSVIVCPRFVCAVCCHEMITLMEMNVIFCGWAGCRQFEQQVSIELEVRKISI